MKKLSILVILMATLLMSGCGFYDRYVTANVTGYSTSCIDGVSYLQFPSGATVQYNADGTVKKCK